MDGGPFPTAIGVNYDSIHDGALVEQMQSAARRIRKYIDDGVIEVGLELIALNEKLEHGMFTALVEIELKMHIRTAERSMAAARLITKNEKLSYLPSSSLSLLAARSTPAEAIDAVSSRVDVGERPSAKQISALIAQTREEKKKLERQQAQERELRHNGELRARRRLSAEEHLEKDKQLAKLRMRESKKREEKEAQRRGVVGGAARMLAEHLKGRLDEFMELVDRVGWYDVRAALSEIRDAQGLQPRSE